MIKSHKEHQKLKEAQINQVNVYMASGLSYH